jgi:outer membrane protein assembly factor BamE (lipoprotein component of BamABCDE complex)
VSLPDDEEDGFGPRPGIRKPSTSPAVVTVAAILLGGCLGLGLYFAFESVRGVGPQPEPPKTRDEMRQLLVGKTKDEVRTLLGRPSDEDAGPAHHWDYRNVTHDPAGDLIDPLLRVHFGPDGRVSAVE